MSEQRTRKMKRNMGKMNNYVVVLSGNYVHSDPRIKKGLEILEDEKIIFNGFNLKEEHDNGFEGDWQDDLRLKKYVKNIEDLIKKDRAKIFYARTTCENACRLAEEDNSGKYKIVTSDFHVKRCKHIFRKFLHPYSTEFVGVQTAKDLKELHRLKLHEIIQELFCHYAFHGLNRGDNLKKINNTYNEREVKAKKFLRKIFGRNF